MINVKLYYDWSVMDRFQNGPLFFLVIPEPTRNLENYQDIKKIRKIKVDKRLSFENYHQNLNVK